MSPGLRTDTLAILVLEKFAMEAGMLETPQMPNRYLRTSEAGRFVGLSGRTLEKHRTYGTGPTYRKIGGRVVYAVTDLQTWADRGAQTSTTDRTADRVHPARRREVETWPHT